MKCIKNCRCGRHTKRTHSAAGKFNHSDWQRDRKAKTRALLRDLKITAGCIDCGYDENPDALQFDHLDGKSFNVSQITHYGGKRLFEEINKCEVRCANCHSIKSAREARERYELNHAL